MSLFKRAVIGAVLLAVSQLAISQSANLETEDTKAQALFEQFFEEQVSLSPMYQTHLGRKTHYGEWDDISPAQSALYLRLSQDQLLRLKRLDVSKLNADNQLSVELMRFELEQNINGYQWRDHNYPVNQMFGLHATVASFLINSHQINNINEANAYISRLQGVNALLTQLSSNLKRRAQQGILAPAFVYPQVRSDIVNITTGKPFDSNSDKPSPLQADFIRKVNALDLKPELRQQLLAAADLALLGSVKLGYQQLLATWDELAKKADNRDGAWKFPRGDAYYNYALEKITTTNMSANEIHQLGLTEVERLHAEMDIIKQAVGFSGSLPEFYKKLQDDPALYYRDNDAGRAQYLADTQALIDAMHTRLPELFGHLPKAELNVKAVEPFREKSAGKAFYQSPAVDGSRPGIYYVNLHDLSAMPRYQMEALAYHEALPGHHMQIAIAQELADLPAFRRHGGYTAYTEGWGLYAEQVPKEIGLYTDPYSDFGRLSFELWRAVRLVVDTGIHHLKWSREQAIDYFVENTPMIRDDARREVERYIVMPGQATSYKIGMNAILALRAEAKKELGPRFSLKAFHDQVLGAGALPLTILERRIRHWIATGTHEPQ
ncbi:DUF885 domain-containing protein [Gilvimarinus polysaccharolyticus]|uniref:DUF885 domain-containing protein n=1 Tax=Gilvimarinus polysaccharolyticus TaxID=863921 RepID=UPI000673B8F9|nr:DUF885 domain-containing protein [Gilvimarinus polysaccharolyticus]